MSAPTSGMKRAVPWLNKEEFDSVFEKLYSNELHNQKRALARIAVWKCRALHRLSTAIECTYHVLSAVMHDQEMRCTVTLDTMQCDLLRMNYAMALVRFVNLLTENDQPRAYTQPVQLVAQELGIPLWMVELRHDATHSTLPALPVLRTAAEFALDWLKQHYWQAQLYQTPAPRTRRDSVVSVDSLPDTMSDPHDVLSEALIEHMQIMFNAVMGLRRLASSRKHELSTVMMLNRDAVVDKVVQDGYLLSTRQQLEALNINVEEFLHCHTPPLPPALVHMWRAMLVQIHHFHLTPALLQALLCRLCGDNDLTDRLVTGWVTVILDGITHPGVKQHQDGRLVQPLYNHQCVIDGRALLQLAVLNPNCYTSTLISRLFKFCNPELTRQQQQQLLALVNCSIKQSSQKTLNGDDSLHSVEELYRRINGRHGDASCHDNTSHHDATGRYGNRGLNSMNIQDSNTASGLSNKSYSGTPCDVTEVPGSHGSIHNIPAVAELGNPIVHCGDVLNCATTTTTAQQRWTLDAGIHDWASCPIGSCPGQVIDFEVLELSLLTTPVVEKSTNTSADTRSTQPTSANIGMTSDTVEEMEVTNVECETLDTNNDEISSDGINLWNASEFDLLKRKIWVL